MKILENPNYVKVTCPHCKSELGVHLQDIMYNELAHGHHPEFSCTCAACNRNVELPSKMIPLSWLRQLIDD